MARNERSSYLRFVKSVLWRGQRVLFWQSFSAQIHGRALHVALALDRPGPGITSPRDDLSDLAMQASPFLQKSLYRRPILLCESRKQNDMYGTRARDLTFHVYVLVFLRKQWSMDKLFE